MGIKSIGDTDARRRLVSPGCGLSVNSQLELLDISKGAYCYKLNGESAENFELMKEIDREHTEHPTKGVDGMVSHLSLQGFLVGP